MTTSATGGYLSPTTQLLPGGLTLVQYLQAVIVGITSLPGDLVRPGWQANPPKRPDISVNWCSFSVMVMSPDANAYVEEKADGSGQKMQRHEVIQLVCRFYGPLCQDFAGVLRDGLQLSQNRDSLSAGNMGFQGTSETVFVPELLNERFFQRCDITVFLTRQINRDYQVLSFESAGGEIEALKDNDETEEITWEVIENQ